MDGMLSQEEINALLGGMGDSEDDTTTTSEDEINDVYSFQIKQPLNLNQAVPFHTLKSRSQILVR